ncbi:hypothetical protein D3C84_1211720 [compost metagenome]
MRPKWLWIHSAKLALAKSVGFLAKGNSSKSFTAPAISGRGAVFSRFGRFKG